MARSSIWQAVWWLIAVAVACKARAVPSPPPAQPSDGGADPHPVARQALRVPNPAEPIAGPSESESRQARLRGGGTDRRLMGTPGELLSVSFVPPDGRYALASGVDNVALVWDTRTGKPIHRFSGKVYRFNSLALARDGAHALTDGDLGAHYWEIATGKVVRTLHPAKRDGFFSTVALSPDEHGAATGGSDGVTFWDLDAETPIRRIADGDAVSITYSRDGRRAFWLGVAERLCQVALSEHDAPRCIEINARRLDVADVEPETLLTAGRYGNLAVWATGTGRKIKEWQAHEQAIDSLAFLPSRMLAASAGEDHVIRVWNTNEAKLLFERQIAGFGEPVALSSDGGRVLYGAQKGEVHLWTLLDEAKPAQVP